jgi:hypothetical protein
MVMSKQEHGSVGEAATGTGEDRHLTSLTPERLTMLRSMADSMLKQPDDAPVHGIGLIITELLDALAVRQQVTTATADALVERCATLCDEEADTFRPGANRSYNDMDEGSTMASEELARRIRTLKGSFQIAPAAALPEKHQESPYIQPEPGEHATVSIVIGGDALPGCMWCGKVKPRAGWKSKCRGKVGISLRGGEAAG